MAPGLACGRDEDAAAPGVDAGRLSVGTAATEARAAGRSDSVTASDSASRTAAWAGAETATGLRTGRASASRIRAPRSASLRPPAPAWAVRRSRNNCPISRISSALSAACWTGSEALPSSSCELREGRAGGRFEPPSAGAAAGVLAAGLAAGCGAGVEAGVAAGAAARAGRAAGRAPVRRGGSAWLRCA
ncbi:hypothetical protein D3P05_23820 [Paracoccus siganidrum]|uniref:Uncharacterized protein n=1 Tax=Paracoccus siganidrum TaxID=1276757 RepID=A0A418ZRC7_9RHOB|nr:hypothetical protein D3P05_23820 [Paracoccus siganidrum]